MPSSAAGGRPRRPRPPRAPRSEAAGPPRGACAPPPVALAKIAELTEEDLPDAILDVDELSEAGRFSSSADDHVVVVARVSWRHDPPSPRPPCRSRSRRRRSARGAR
jgi:hypothetical protein